MRALKRCQSCGMPLRRDERGGGTNGDGTVSTTYCSHCFQNGEFTRPDVTPEEMRRLVLAKLQDSGIPGLAARLLTRGIPKLARWKATEGSRPGGPRY